MSRVERIVVATLALAGAGALAGALVGAVALPFSMLVTQAGNPAAGVVIGAFLGAPFGTILAPVLGWLLLRRAPIGRMFVQCGAGSAIGGVVGWVGAVSIAAPLGGLMGACTGCVVAALLLRHRLEA